MTLPQDPELDFFKKKDKTFSIPMPAQALYFMRESITFFAVVFLHVSS